MFRPRVGLLRAWRAPYFDPLVARLTARGNTRTDVLLMYAKDPAHGYLQHAEGSPVYIAPGRVRRVPVVGDVHVGLIRHIGRSGYDVLAVLGHSYCVSWFGILQSLVRGRPYIYCADSVLAGRRRSAKSTVRDLAVTMLVRKASAVWVPGAASRRYMETYGVPAARIFEGYYSLDGPAIAGEVDRQRTMRDARRASLDISPEAFVFLMVANLTPRRRHAMLLEAFRSLESPRAPYLVLVGTGAEEVALKAYCLRHRMENVRYVGNVQFDELAANYAMADAYVHTGTEPYSTAVVYGALAGLPVITTKQIGGGEDLVVGEISPLMVDAEDRTGLARCLLGVLSDPVRGRQLGERLREIALARSVDWAAEQFERAVDSALMGQGCCRGGCRR